MLVLKEFRNQGRTDGTKVKKTGRNHDNQLDEMHTHFFVQFLYKPVVAISISKAPPQWTYYDGV